MCTSHVLALDGVDDEQGELAFHSLASPSSAEVARIACRTAQRLYRAFHKKGRQSPWNDEHAFVDSGRTDPVSLGQPGLCLLKGRSRWGRRLGRASWAARAAVARRRQDQPRATKPVAEALGVNVYAKPCVDGRDRK